LGHPDIPRFEGVNDGSQGVLAFYEAAHIDPFALRQDFFKAEPPRDVARFNDFRSVLQHQPYSFLLGYEDVETLDEMRMGEDNYIRRVRVDGRSATFTFCLGKRHGRWGVDFLLAERDVDEAVQAGRG
jgi:hypothetical protein